MDGNNALRLLMAMPEEERKAVCIVWLDKDMFSDDKVLNADNDTLKEVFDNALLTEGGDVQKYYEDFLDGFHDKVLEKI